MSRFSLSLTEVAAPLAALDLSAQHVCGAVLELRGGEPTVVAYAVEPLPADALVPSLNASNIRDRVAVLDAVRRVVERIGKPRRIGLVIADPAVKVSLIRLQQVPARAQDLDQVIRWQVRKSAPFAIDEAQVSYAAGLADEEGHEFIVTLARRDVIQEYEALCADAGAHAGIVDLSTFSVANAVLASGAAPAGDWLLVNVAADWASVAIMRGRHLVFFRTRGADGEGTFADVVHQTAMYYEDRLSGKGFSRVLVCGGTHAPDADMLSRRLADRLATPVEVVDPRRAAPLAGQSGASPELLDALGPLVGMVLRSREVTA